MRSGRRYSAARPPVHHAELLRFLQQRVRVCDEAVDTDGLRVEDQQGEDCANYSKCGGDRHRGGEARFLLPSVQRLDIQADETGLGRRAGAPAVAADPAAQQRAEAARTGRAGGRRLRGEPRGGRLQHVRKRDGSEFETADCLHRYRRCFASNYQAKSVSAPFKVNKCSFFTRFSGERYEDPGRI